MTGTRTLYYAVSCCVLFLAGCGGGGGDSAPASVPTPGGGPPATTSGIAGNLQAPNTTVTFQAAATTAVGANWTTASISQAGQGATITLTTDASGNLSSITIPAAGFTGTIGPGNFRLTDPLTLDFSYQVSTEMLPGDKSWKLSQVAAGQGLTSSAYGLWGSVGKSQPGDDGAFAIGNLTAPTSMPTTGSATFNGFTMGMGGAADGSTGYAIQGNAQIIANFTTLSVTTNMTNFVAHTPAPTPSIPNLTGTSTLSGNAYAGTIFGGGLGGLINGNFYGSAAQETAGVWHVTGGGSAYIGSFGAKQ